jgi:molecular chaperone HtpG
MAMFGGAMPDMYNLVINTNHPVIGKILGEKNKKKQTELTKRTADLALLSQNMLKGEELTKFINQSLEQI